MMTSLNTFKWCPYHSSAAFSGSDGSMSAANLPNWVNSHQYQPYCLSRDVPLHCLSSLVQSSTDQEPYSSPLLWNASSIEDRLELDFPIEVVGVQHQGDYRPLLCCVTNLMLIPGVVLPARPARCFEAVFGHGIVACSCTFATGSYTIWFTRQVSMTAQQSLKVTAVSAAFVSCEDSCQVVCA